MKKTVFITGSTRGIGRTMAMSFAKKDYNVVLNGRNKTKDSQSFINKIKRIAPRSEIYYFDISNAAEVEKNCQQILHTFKRIDVLINNAATVKNKLLVQMNNDDFDTVIKINLYGTFYITKHIIPSMIKNNWGRVINLSSISALIGDFGQTNYSASKAAIIGFTKSLAKEVAKYNITVNAICPGLVETDILKDVPQKYMNTLIERIPLKRLAKTEEIADLALFLASDSSRYITGQSVNINGGMI